MSMCSHLLQPTAWTTNACGPLHSWRQPRKQSMHSSQTRHGSQCSPYSGSSMSPASGLAAAAAEVKAGLNSPRRRTWEGKWQGTRDAAIRHAWLPGCQAARLHAARMRHGNEPCTPVAAVRAAQQWRLNCCWPARTHLAAVGRAQPPALDRVKHRDLRQKQYDTVMSRGYGVGWNPSEPCTPGAGLAARSAVTTCRLFHTGAHLPQHIRSRELIKHQHLQPATRGAPHDAEHEHEWIDGAPMCAPHCRVLQPPQT